MTEVCVYVCVTRVLFRRSEIFFSFPNYSARRTAVYTHTQEGRATHRPAAGDNVYTSVCIYRREREKNKYTSSKELGLFRRESVTELWPRKRII
jgi:hypothetical protein